MANYNMADVTVNSADNNKVCISVVDCLNSLKASQLRDKPISLLFKMGNLSGTTITNLFNISFKQFWIWKESGRRLAAILLSGCIQTLRRYWYKVMKVLPQ